MFWDIPPQVEDPSINELARKLQPNIEVEKQSRKKMTPKQKKDLIFVWSMLAVFIVYWLVFYLYVNLDSILLAF